MSAIQYLDLKIQVERSDSIYRAQIIDSPGGQASTNFELPLDVEELQAFLSRMPSGTQSDLKIAQRLGSQLFQTLFTGQMQSCLRSSLDEAERRGLGLRFSLRLNDAPELVNLPWEYLYHPEKANFLSLSANTPLVRYVKMARRTTPLPVRMPLRILAMVSNPHDFRPLDAELEWNKLLEATLPLRKAGLVTLDRLPKATLPALQAQLRRSRYHIFYYIGHGSYDSQNEQGLLLFEHEDGSGRAVSGRLLGTLLQDERTLRLALLNACEGAKASTHDPYSSVAQSLLRYGLPAVIAMQFPITDQAAVTLTQEFCRALADNYPVDGALAEARKALFATGNLLEWGTPVLYMRIQNGRIFDVDQSGVGNYDALSSTSAPLSKVEEETEIVTLPAIYPSRVPESPLITTPSGVELPSTSELRKHFERAIHSTSGASALPVRLDSPSSMQGQGAKRWFSFGKALFGTGTVAAVAILLLVLVPVFAPQSATPVTSSPVTQPAAQENAAADREVVNQASERGSTDDQQVYPVQTEEIPPLVFDPHVEQSENHADIAALPVSLAQAGRAGFKESLQTAQVPEMALLPALNTQPVSAALMRKIRQTMAKNQFQLRSDHHLAVFGIVGKGDVRLLIKGEPERGFTVVDEDFDLKHLLEFKGLMFRQESDDAATAVHPGDVELHIEFNPNVQAELHFLLLPDMDDQPGILAATAGQARLASDHGIRLLNAVEANDLPEAQRHAEHIINILSGEDDRVYGDLNGDGLVENPGDGMGLLYYVDLIGEHLNFVGAEMGVDDDAVLHLNRSIESAEALRAEFLHALELARNVIATKSAPDALGRALQLQLLLKTISADDDNEELPNLMLLTQQIVHLAQFTLLD